MFKNHDCILITGVAGFIGSNLADYLLSDASLNVVGIDNFDDNYSAEIKKENLHNAMMNPRFKFYQADIRNPNEIENVFRKNKIETVIHLAAKVGVRTSMNQPIEYLNTNELGTANIL
jgi:UDP-glucuronate 4-epimerase